MNVTILHLDKFFFVKYSTTYHVDAVYYMSGMAKFYNLWYKESSIKILPDIVSVHAF